MCTSCQYINIIGMLMLPKPNDTLISSLCGPVQPVSRSVNLATAEFCLVNKRQGQLCIAQQRAQMGNAIRIQAAHSTGQHLQLLLKSLRMSLHSDVTKIMAEGRNKQCSRNL